MSEKSWSEACEASVAACFADDDIPNRPITRKYIQELNISNPIKNELIGLLNKIKKQKKDVEKEKKELEEHTLKMNSILELNQHKFDEYVNRQNNILNNMESKCCGDEWICINVGGKKFQTRRQTLLNISPYFVRLLSNKMTPSRDSEGYIFIDRDPSFFQDILNFGRLCKNEIVFDHISSRYSKNMLSQELDYYGIETDININILPDINSAIRIYWGGDGKKYDGVVKEVDIKRNMIKVKYNDGEIWEYDYDILVRQKKNRFWHYQTATLLAAT